MRKIRLKITVRELQISQQAKLSHSGHSETIEDIQWGELWTLYHFSGG